MVKIKICGDSVTIVSSKKKEDLQLLKKWSPETLALINNENKEAVFAIGLGSTPSFNKVGINFTSETADGFASVTLPIPTDVEDKEAYITDKWGAGVLALNTLESFLDEHIAQVRNNMENINASIETL